MRNGYDWSESVKRVLSCQLKVLWTVTMIVVTVQHRPACTYCHVFSYNRTDRSSSIARLPAQTLLCFHNTCIECVQTLKFRGIMREQIAIYAQSGCFALQIDTSRSLGQINKQIYFSYASNTWNRISLKCLEVQYERKE